MGKDKRLTRKDFATCLPHQCKAAELRNGGEGILQKMERDLTQILTPTPSVPSR